MRFTIKGNQINIAQIIIFTIIIHKSNQIIHKSNQIKSYSGPLLKKSNFKAGDLK